MSTLPGYGDEATWGPVCDPRDPRYDSSKDDAIEAEMERQWDKAYEHPTAEQVGEWCGTFDCDDFWDAVARTTDPKLREEIKKLWKKAYDQWHDNGMDPIGCDPSWRD